MKTAALLCIYSRSTVHCVISAATNAYPVAPFAHYLWEVLSVVSSHVTCGFCETSHNKKQYGWNQFHFSPWKKQDSKLWSVVTESSQKNLWAWTLKWCFRKGECRSIKPVLNFFSIMKQYSETLLSETGGGARATRRVARMIWLRSSNRLIARR